MVICHLIQEILFDIFSCFSIILEPVAPEPVNDIILTLGCSLNGLPTPSPSPLTKLNAPLGTPAFQRFQLK